MWGWGVIIRNGLVGHFYTFKGFLRSRYRVGIFFGTIKFSNIISFGVCLIFLKTVDAGSKPTYDGKLKIHPGESVGKDLYFYSSLVWVARD